MALYNETDDWQRFAREQMQNSAQNLQQKQAGLDAAKNQKTKTTLESALSGLVTGIGERIGDIGSTLNNMGKTVVGGINQIGQNKAIENTTKKDSERRNEIAKKYGFNSYSEAANSGKVGDDFWNEIKSSNDQTKKEQKEVTDKYRNTGKYGDVTKVNTNLAKGQALNTIDSVLSLIPGAGGVVANVAGGAISGVGDEYKRVGREGGSFNLDNALKNAAVGGASGLAGSAGSAGLGKVATKFGGNAVGKALGSNLASGVAGGASAGAIGGALGTALNGGTLEDALLAAKEGAKAGGIGGGVMAGTMGLGGTALEKLRNRGTTAQAIEPVDAQIVQKNRIEAPTAERIPSTVEAVEPVSNKRGIAITDLDAGEQAINVRNANKQASRGKYIDGVVKGKNLPEAEAPAYARVAEPVIAADGNYFVNDGINRLKTVNGRVNTYAGEGEWNGAPVYWQDGRGLPDGYSLMFDENAAPANNYVAIENPNGNKALIELPQSSEYDYERVGMATGRDREGLMDSGLIAPEGGFRGAGTPRKINIESALTNTQDVPVESLTTNYRRSTIPARQYDQQTIKAMPEAEIATPKTIATAETATAQPQRQVAADISPADQARLEREISVLEQKQGNELLKQYGVLDKPTRRKVGDAPKVLANIQDSMGLTTPAEVQFAANHITGKDGVLAKATNKLASTATVDTRLDPTFIESLIQKNGLTDTEAKAVRNQINGALQELGQNRKYVNGTDVLDTVKKLQSIQRDYEGANGSYHNQTNAEKFKVHVIQGVAQELEDRLWSAADPNIDQVITPKLLNSMKQMYPDNATWQNFVDTTVANAQNGKELRAIQKPLVLGGDIVKGSNMSSGSVGEALANGAMQAGGAKGVAKNAVKVIADKVMNSPKQQQKRANNYQEQKRNAESQLYGETPINTNTSKLGAIAGKAGDIAQGAKNLGNKVAGIANNATASLNNDYLAGINGIRTRNGNPIEFNALGNQAQQFANKQMGKAEAERSQNRLENAQAVANAQADYDNALADYNAQEANYNANMAQAQNQATGASQLDRIAAAMEMALNAGDITAYGQLADLYKQAAEIEELKNPTKTTSPKALSANQAKALTAQQQLDALSQMTPDAGTVASNIPILSGIVNLTGGNEYANQASSLATTLGYLLSGANIKESEAQRIGQAYVPTAFDSEAVRKQKLERARQLIQSYMSDTGAIEQ